MKAQFAEVSALDAAGAATARHMLEQLVRALLQNGCAEAHDRDRDRVDNKPMRLSKDHKPVQPMEQSPCC